MLSSNIYQKRLQDLADNIARDMKLLNEFEEALRYEDNPRLIARYRRGIERQQESVTKYQQEFDELQQKLRDLPSAQMQVQKVGSLLQQMDGKLIDAIAQSARVLMVSPDELEKVWNALDKHPSVIRRKEQHEDQWAEIQLQLIIPNKQGTRKQKEQKNKSELQPGIQGSYSLGEKIEEQELSPADVERIFQDLRIQNSDRDQVETHCQGKKITKNLLAKDSIIRSALKNQKSFTPLGHISKVQILAEALDIDVKKTQEMFDSDPVDSEIFKRVCLELNINWKEILDIGFLKTLKLVAQLRVKRSGRIQDQCGKMQILNVRRPIDINNLYVDVNILETPSSDQYLGWNDLPKVYNPETEQFDRPKFTKVLQERVPGREAVENNLKLMVLGKPGAGKTTFLKYIAIQCNDGEFQSDRFPIFIGLRKFAEEASHREELGLLKYIQQELIKYGISDELATEEMLKYGRGLILLDGLDEVSEKDNHKVIEEVKKISEDYRRNLIVITCRITASEYTFTGFTYVEIADFDRGQIELFAKNWFAAFKDDRDLGTNKARSFIGQLNLAENQPIQELATTPILLTLACLVFQQSKKFPSNRSQLYKQGIEILLRRWDEFRGIQRDELYRNLSLAHKLNLLSRVAKITFKNNRYFFYKEEIQSYIADYIRNLSETSDYPDQLEWDSGIVLNSIEVQHGLIVERTQEIYSFSHLTFQEYFTASAFVNSSNIQDLDELARFISEKRWREVFLIATGIGKNTEQLLWSIKTQVDKILESDAKLQEFLGWSHQKYQSVKIPQKPVAIRAFYQFFAQKFGSSDKIVDYDQCLDLAHYFDKNFSSTSNSALRSDLVLAVALAYTYKLFDNLPYVEQDSIICRTDGSETIGFPMGELFDCLENESHPCKLKKALSVLRDKLPSRYGLLEFFNWWETNGEDWSKHLREVMIEYGNIGHDWQFCEKQKNLLQQYYNANKLLVDCLNIAIASEYITDKKHQEFEDSLLLPIAYQSNISQTI